MEQDSNKIKPNIIFLDIDGVIWHHKFRDEHPEAGMLDNDKVAMELIGKLAVETASKIVMSSSWRYSNDTLDQLKDVMGKGGASDEFLDLIIGWTPKLKASRGKEIGRWIGKHHDEIGNYVILDDAEKYNFLEEQLSHLVMTKMETGFTKRQAYYAKRKLLAKR